MAVPPEGSVVRLRVTGPVDIDDADWRHRLWRVVCRVIGHRYRPATCMVESGKRFGCPRWEIFRHPVCTRCDRPQDYAYVPLVLDDNPKGVRVEVISVEGKR